MEDFNFKIKRIGVAVALHDSGILIKPDRLDVEITQNLLKILFNLATQEEPLHKQPADWWQHFKERWFPRWARHLSPVKYVEVWAAHKYPEVSVPESVLGREFVHVKIISAEEIDRWTNTTSA